MTLDSEDMYFVQRALAYAIAAHEQKPHDRMSLHDVSGMTRLLKQLVGPDPFIEMIEEARQLLTGEGLPDES